MFIEDTLGIFGEAAAPVSNLAADTDNTTTNSVLTGDATTGDTVEAGSVNADASSGSDLESDVLGERIAPIVKAAEDGTFDRNMLFDEEAKKLPVTIWLLFFVMGAAGVGVYQSMRKKKITVKSDK